MEKFEVELIEDSSDKQLDIAACALENAVYKAAVDIFEELEHNHKIYGNGHHLAQDVAAYAKRLLLLRWNNKEKEFTQHISIAGDNESQQTPSSPWLENPTGADNNLIYVE